MKIKCDVIQATHVRVGTQIFKIQSKWGVSKDGKLAAPSEGGFGVFTEDGRRITMWEASGYLVEDRRRNLP